MRVRANFDLTARLGFLGFPGFLGFLVLAALLSFGLATDVSAQTDPAAEADPAAPAAAPVAEAAGESDAKPAPAAADDNQDGSTEPVFPFSTGPDGLPLDSFIHWSSVALKKTFIWTPAALQAAGAKGGNNKRVIVTQEMKIPKSALLDFVCTNLQVHKLALVPVGPPGAEFILVESLDSPTLLQTKRVFVPSEKLDDYKNSYTLIVTTIHVEHVNVQQIQTQIQRLITQATVYGSSIIPAPSENAFILIDFGPNVYNIARLIKEMDQQGVRFNQTLDIIPLEFADPGEIEAILTEILQNEGTGGGQPGVPQPYAGVKQAPQAKIIPDERASRLVVWAVAEDHAKIRDLVKRLDTDVKASTGRIRFYQLQNSVAEEVAETLKAIMEGSGGGSSRPGGSGPGQATLLTGSGGDKVDIVADKGSNALLIRASKTRILEVIELIKELDQRKRQVLVEAAIVELQHDNNMDLGVELGIFDAKDDLADTFRPFGYTSLGLSSVEVSENGIFRVPNTAAQGVIGGIFDGDGFLFPVLINAYQQKGYTNVMSMPSVLTNDNQEASIKVSRSIPYSQLNQGAAGQVSTQTFGDYAEAPIELTISPHIASNDYLRLDLRFLVEVFGSGGSPGIPPPKTSREIVTAVTVPNGATVVIGGLTLDDQRETVRQIPILGDIPILGWLFRTTSTTHQKNTLFLFLTPRILSDPDFADLDEISTRKKAEIAALDGQVELVDPEFGRRFDMRDQRRTIEDIESSGAFDIGVVYSPIDEDIENAGAESNGRGKKSGAGRMIPESTPEPKPEADAQPEKPAVAPKTVAPKTVAPKTVAPKTAAPEKTTPEKTGAGNTRAETAPPESDGK